MKKQLLLLILSFFALNGIAIGIKTKKDFEFDIYGQIRADLFYNSRVNEESVDGLFYGYPKDYKYDSRGEDLNDEANSNMYLVYSRLGLNVKGPKLGNAKTSAKIEFDFRGSGSTLSTVRLRHAYLNLDWEKSSLLVGQTWNPLYGDVAPQILNLNMGSPFQPFGRAPQVRYRYNHNNLQLTASALWQSQYLSAGPDENDITKTVKNNKFIKNSCLPEIYLGADYKTKNLLIGGGIDIISLVPRTQASINDSTIYKINERITSVSGEVHVKYTSPMWYIAAKSVLGSNLTHASMLGGYGVKSIDPITTEQEYTPNRNSSSWINVVYGKKWKVGVFGGYMKNLGTDDAIDSNAPTKMYGSGTNVDQIVSGSAEVTYNLPNWKMGIEYNYTTAWYGDLNTNNGKVINTHSINNNRIVASIIFMF